MSAKFHSIPPERLRAAVTAHHAALAESNFARAMAASPLYGRWETEDGSGIGDPIALDPPEELMLEHPDGKGGFGATLTQLPLAFVSEPPEAASHFGMSGLLCSWPEASLILLSINNARNQGKTCINSKSFSGDCP